MKSMLLIATSRETPCDSSAESKAVQDGSTPVLVKPFSESYPIRATCLNDPCVGPEIIDLSILPPLVDFFFDEDALALPTPVSYRKQPKVELSTNLIQPFC